MTIQEVYNTQLVRDVEYQIIQSQWQGEKGFWGGETKRAVVRNLLHIRKRIMDEMFEMDEHYLQLLSDFNEAIKQQMIEMRKRTIALYESVAKAGLPGTIEVEGKCFLGYDYPPLHPIQDRRAKQMWEILNGARDNYMPMYDDGLGQFRITTYHSPTPEIESEQQMLYWSEETENHNEGLDREMTKDLHLIFPFRDLFYHMEFSIFDLLWVRDFHIDLNVEIWQRGDKSSME